MGNAFLAVAPVGFFAIVGLFACAMLGWLLHDMLPVLREETSADHRARARRAARSGANPSRTIRFAPAPVRLRRAAA